METSAKPRLGDLDRREMHLTLFACSAITILAVGTAAFMYPVVFSEAGADVNRTMRVPFFGFCVLSLLLAGYLFDRQRTIQRLRAEMAEERRRALEAETQASQELLKAMPKLNSFQDSLPMEFRRTTATTQKLSVLVVTLEPLAGSPSRTIPSSALSEAAKAISHKLREGDSMFILGPACVGAVLPGADTQIAESLCGRISEGLDGPKARDRFCYAIKIVNYPAHASSATELQRAVCRLIPSDDSMRAIAETLN